MGEEELFFLTVLKTNSSRRAPPAPLPAALPPGAPTHPPSEPLPTRIRGLVATPRRRNRTSSHVSRVSRGPPRPSPMARPAPSAGLRVRAPGSIRRGARAGGRAGAWAAGPRARGSARARQAGPGRASWLPQLLRSSRCVVIIIFVKARPAGGRARRAPRRYWGAGAVAGALLACGTTAGRRAAILSPWLLSLWGGGVQSLAPSPRRPRTWRQQGKPAPGTPGGALGP